MMKLTALIMAGGRGERLGLKVEKPMLDIGGAPMIRKVIDACRGSIYIDEVMVAVSEYTPMTREYAERIGFCRVVDTPGNGYHEDMHYMISRFRKGSYLVIAADLPALTNETIDKIAEYYLSCEKPALAVMAPLSLFSTYGLKPTFTMKVEGNDCVPCGINAIKGSMIDQDYIDEKMLVIDDPSVCININTLNDFEALLEGKWIKK
jgi:adenosylcobinamide-phosphate guanylyltransferase